MFFKIYFMYSILDDENMLLICVFLESLVYLQGSWLLVSEIIWF